MQGDKFSTLNINKPTFLNKITTTKEEPINSFFKKFRKPEEPEEKPDFNEFLLKYLKRQSMSKKEFTEEERIRIESDLRTNKKHKCNCQRTKCLKLYCDCLKNNEYCFDCQCEECENIYENEQNIKFLRERFSELYQDKQSYINKSKDSGCTCTRSSCLKKYCECFKNGISCSEMCRCLNCLNNEQYQKNLKSEPQSSEKSISLPFKITKMKGKKEESTSPNPNKIRDHDFYSNRSIIFEKLSIDYFDKELHIESSAYSNYNDFIKKENKIIVSDFNSNLCVYQKEDEHNLIINKKILQQKREREEALPKDESIDINTPKREKEDEKEKKRMITIKKIIDNFSSIKKNRNKIN
jgi:hypothetical protein